MPIRYLKGDATDPQGLGPRIIVHCCNNLGGWGAGFTRSLSARWGKAEDAYRQWYRQESKGAMTVDAPIMETSGIFKLGEIQMVLVASQLWVCNLIGQKGIGIEAGQRPPVRYESIQLGLRKLRRHAQAKTATVHMPRMGCGLAGGTWKGIKQMVDEELTTKNVSVTVYDLP